MREGVWWSELAALVPIDCLCVSKMCLTHSRRWMCWALQRLARGQIKEQSGEGGAGGSGGTFARLLAIVWLRNCSSSTLTCLCVVCVCCSYWHISFQALLILHLFHIALDDTSCWDRPWRRALTHSLALSLPLTASAGSSSSSTPLAHRDPFFFIIFLLIFFLFVSHRAPKGELPSLKLQSPVSSC